MRAGRRVATIAVAPPATAASRRTHGICVQTAAGIHARTREKTSGVREGRTEHRASSGHLARGGNLCFTKNIKKKKRRHKHGRIYGAPTKCTFPVGVFRNISWRYAVVFVITAGAVILARFFSSRPVSAIAPTAQRPYPTHRTLAHVFASSWDGDDVLLPMETTTATLVYIVFPAPQRFFQRKGVQRTTRVLERHAAWRAPTTTRSRSSATALAARRSRRACCSRAPASRMSVELAVSSCIRG